LIIISSLAYIYCYNEHDNISIITSVTNRSRVFGARKICKLQVYLEINEIPLVTK